MTTTTTTAQAITDFRYASTRLRDLTRPSARAVRTGRNNDFTDRCISNYLTSMDVALDALMRADAPRDLTGALVEEHNLLTRGVTGRPELRARLRAARAIVAQHTTQEA